MQRRPHALVVISMLAGVGCGLKESPISGSDNTVGGGSGTTSASAGASQGSPGDAASPSAAGGDDAATVTPGEAAPGSPAADGAVLDGGSADVAAPLSGVTVNIGGTVVPKEKAIVFLHIGHSNMAGRATGPATLHSFFYTTDPHLWAYAKGGVWRPATEPLAADSMTNGAAGPGMAILRSALAIAPDLYIVSIGHGESGDLGGYCRGFRKGAPFYDVVMQPAMELKGKVTFAAIFTMMGIGEFADLGHVPTFTECMQGVVSEMRADLGEPNLPYLVGDWEQGATGKFDPTSPMGMTIKADLRTVTAADAHSKLINTDMVEMQDDHHYDYAGHKLWAERGVALMKQAGWTPWATR